VEERFEFRGIWWLPDDPETQVAGILAFDPDEGASLELLGSFKKNVEDLGAYLGTKLMLGLSSNGKAITLRDCFETRTTMGMPGMITSTFHADMVLVGAHFEKEADVSFDKLWVEYLHLDEWAHTSGFALKLLEDDTVPRVIEYEPPDPVTVSCGDVEISLRFDHGFGSSNPMVKWATLTQSAYFTIEYPERSPLDDLLKVVYDLQNFLSLGVGEAVYPLMVRSQTHTNARWVDLYYRPTGRLDSAAKVHSAKMRFILPDLDEAFGRSLCNWLEKAEDLDPVYQLYFGTMYNPRAYLRHQFLSLVQGLEAYHRRALVTTEVPEEHQVRLQEILDSVPNRYRSWLEGELAHSHEPNLRRRLNEILGRDPASVKLILGNRKDRDSFVHKVVETRNYLNHFDKSKELIAEREEGLYRITRKLKSLLEVCLLWEIGFEGDRMTKILSRRK
jgi:hypothetical protein